MKLKDYMNKPYDKVKGFSIDRISDSYHRFFISFAISRFEFTNIPTGFLTDAWLTSLIILGKCLVIKKDSKLLAVPYSNEYGMNSDRAIYSNLPFYNRFSDGIYANPILGSDDLEIGKDCVMSYMTCNGFILDDLLIKSANLLAHIDKSIEMVSVNLRCPMLFTSSSQGERKSINEFYTKLYNGDLSVVSASDSILESIKPFPTQQTHSTSITDLINARNNEIRFISRLLGVSMSKDKSQAVLSDEVESDNDFLQATMNTLYDSLQASVNEINDIWGYNLKVSVKNLESKESKESEINEDS